MLDKGIHLSWLQKQRNWSWLTSASDRSSLSESIADWLTVKHEAVTDWLVFRGKFKLSLINKTGLNPVLVFTGYHVSFSLGV